MSKSEKDVGCVCDGETSSTSIGNGTAFRIRAVFKESTCCAGFQPNVEPYLGSVLTPTSLLFSSSNLVSDSLRRTTSDSRVLM